MDHDSQRFAVCGRRSRAAFLFPAETSASKRDRTAADFLSPSPGRLPEGAGPARERFLFGVEAMGVLLSVSARTAAMISATASAQAPASVKSKAHAMERGGVTRRIAALGPPGLWWFRGLAKGRRLGGALRPPWGEVDLSGRGRVLDGGHAVPAGLLVRLAPNQMHSIELGRPSSSTRSGRRCGPRGSATGPPIVGGDR